jgi:hypothetical protein
MSDDVKSASTSKKATKTIHLIGMIEDLKIKAAVADVINADLNYYSEAIVCDVSAEFAKKLAAPLYYMGYKVYYEEKEQQLKILFTKEYDERCPYRQMELFMFYKHFKGKTYLALSVAEHVETGEKLVICETIGGRGKVLAIPVDDFKSKVPLDEDNPTNQTYRFEKKKEEDF